MADKKRIACILADDFEDSELKIPSERLKAAGHGVDIIGTQRGQEIRGKRGELTVRADFGIHQVRPEDFGALLVPGGYSPDRLRADERFVQFVRHFDALGRLVAAVCHGPQILLTAGLVRCRTMTAWSTVQEDLRQAGALVEDKPVVVDRNWITSRKPADLELFSGAMIEALAR